MNKKQCTVCRKTYKRKSKSKEQWDKSQYCSNACYFKARKGSKNPNWKGGIHNRSDGYILVRIDTFLRDYKGKRYDLLHRIVMSQHLGRPLLRGEVVHHLNGNKKDNRIENLEILTQVEHAKKHHIERVRNNKGQYT